MEIIIWGAGKWGQQAYWYYKSKGRIVAYVDIDPNKINKIVPWGDIVVRPVMYIKEHMDAKIVVAVKDKGGISQVLANMGVNSSNIVFFSSSMLCAPVTPKSYRIMIETTNVCNAKCEFCANPTLKRPKKIMDSELFNLILKRISDEKIKVERFILHLNGEPFTDPDLIDRIRKLKQIYPKVPVWFTTNFSLPTLEQIDLLMECGLDAITISLNSTDSNEYFKIMGGLKFERTFNNIRYLLKKNKEKGTPIHVRLSIVDTGNEKKISDFKRMFNDLAEIRVIKLGKWMDSNQSLIPQSYGNNIGICSELMGQICILSNGDYSFCCFDAEGRVGLNVKDVPLLEAFYSSKYEKLREMLRQGSQGTICEKCSWNY